MCTHKIGSCLIFIHSDIEQEEGDAKFHSSNSFLQFQEFAVHLQLQNKMRLISGG